MSLALEKTLMLRVAMRCLCRQKGFPFELSWYVFPLQCLWNFCFLLTLRVIVYRFKQKLKTRLIVLVSLLIVLISFIPHIINTSTEDYTHSPTIFIYNQTYSFSSCQVSNLGVKKVFVHSAIVWTLGIWFPMLLTLVVHIAMFCMIKHNAKKMSASSTQDSSKTILRVSRKFIVIVCAFYLCMLPSTIHSLYMWQLMSKEKLREFNIAVFGPLPHIFVALMNFNSCINPLIYSGIHEKISSAVKPLFSLLKTQLCSAPCCKTTNVETDISLDVVVNNGHLPTINPDLIDPGKEHIVDSSHT